MTGSFGDLIVLSVPRGPIADTRTGLVTTPAGDPVTCQPCEPYPGTQSLELFMADQSQTVVEPLPVIEVPDDRKITRLDTWKRDEPGTA
jgi:hypothetical protein